MTLDWRTLQWPPMGIASDDMQRQGQYTTRFIWRRVCEHCSSSSLMDYGGDLRCQGCYRRANLSPLEDDPPGVG